MESSFARVIEEHLELKRRNGECSGGDSAEEATVAEMRGPVRQFDGAADERTPGGVDYEDTLWGRAREFDWGD